MSGVDIADLRPGSEASSGGGGGGDASAANQTAMIAQLVTLLADTDDLDANTDQIEALLTALGSNTDTLEALVGTTNTNLATLIGLTNPTIVVEPVTADETIAAANWFWGYSLKETSGADPAVVSIHNGNDATDPVIGFINLAAGESVPPTMFPRIPAPDGIHFEVVSGAVSGAIYYEA